MWWHVSIILALGRVSQPGIHTQTVSQKYKWGKGGAVPPSSTWAVSILSLNGVSNGYCLFFDTFCGHTVRLSWLFSREGTWFLLLGHTGNGPALESRILPPPYNTQDGPPKRRSRQKLPGGPHCPLRTLHTHKPLWLSPSLFQATQAYPQNVEGKPKGEAASKHIPPGMVAHKYNPSAREAEAGGSNSDASMSYLMSLFPNTTKRPPCPPRCPHTTGGNKRTARPTFPRSARNPSCRF